MGSLRFNPFPPIKIRKCFYYWGIFLSVSSLLRALALAPGRLLLLLFLLLLLVLLRLLLLLLQLLLLPLLLPFALAFVLALTPALAPALAPDLPNAN